jgi:hypothetical protein
MPMISSDYPPSRWRTKGHTTGAAQVCFAAAAPGGGKGEGGKRASPLREITLP